ncbi:MAG: hypothetical protein L0H31_11655 [Nocardioidaceae bacterium]|nr:hypothetical protein [Nocardioidaceae bacterium]
MLNTVRTVAYLAVAMVVLSMTTMLTRRPDTSMVVAGRPGRGKTTLVRSILSELDLRDRAHAIARTARERSKDETGAISLETILVAVGLAAAAGVVVALIAAAIADAGANL